MNIFKKLVDTVRSGVNELGEAIIDNRAVNILEQELRDARSALDELKTNLTAVMAERIGVDRKVAVLENNIQEHEGYVLKALQKGDDVLAKDVAGKIAEYEQEVVVQKGVLDGYENRVSAFKKLIRQSERNIQAMELEIAAVKTTEKVQRANNFMSARDSGSKSKLRSATDSLDRIRQRQQEREDRIAAALELEEETHKDDLHERLKQAGIIEEQNTTAEAVLARMKKQNEENG